MSKNQKQSEVQKHLDGACRYHAYGLSNCSRQFGEEAKECGLIGEHFAICMIQNLCKKEYQKLMECQEKGNSSCEREIQQLEK